MTKPRPQIVRRESLATSFAALAAFGLIASLDEPTQLDWGVYHWARRAFRRPIEVAQAPLELVGLPGAYIPITVFAVRKLRRRGLNGGRTIIMGAVAGWLTVRLMRRLIWRPRPPNPPRKRNDTESTFPSGHTTGVTTLTTVATAVLRDDQILTPREAMALRVAIPFLFGLSRVYVQEHWLTDVLGGLALGTAVGSAILVVAGQRSRRRPRVASSLSARRSHHASAERTQCRSG